MSAPSVCPCRFCEERYTAAGISNHERWCPENPERGMHPDRAEELGLLGDVEEEATPSDPDPDQRADTAGALPPREVLPERADESTATATPDDRCPRCESTATIAAHQAREEYAKALDGELPDSLAATFDATEEYCTECFSVFGGLLDEPWPLTEGMK